MQRIPLILVCLIAVLGLAWLFFAPRPEVALRRGITVLALSAYGKLAVGNADGRVALLDIGSPAPVIEVRRDGPALNDLRFSSDGKTLLVAARDVWSWQNGTLSRITKDQRNYGCIRYSTDGKRVFWSTGNGEIEARSTESMGLIWRNCCSTVYGDLAVSPDGETLASAGHEPRLWRTSDGEMQQSLLPYKNFTFRPILYSRLGDRIWLGSQDGSVWDVKFALRSPAAPHYIDSIAELPGGWLAFGAAENPIRLWQPETGLSGILSEAIPSSNLVSNLGSGQSGDLVFGNRNGEIEVWSINPRKRLSRRPVL